MVLKDRITPETGWLCDDVSDYIEVLKRFNLTCEFLKRKVKQQEKEQ
jgi:hypothetical protein